MLTINHLIEILSNFYLLILINVTLTQINCKLEPVYSKVSSHHCFQFYSTFLTPALSSCWGDTVELRQCRSNFKTYNENQEKVKVFLLPKKIKPEARFNRFFSFWGKMFLQCAKHLKQLYIKGGTKPVYTLLFCSIFTRVNVSIKFREKSRLLKCT